MNLPINSYFKRLAATIMLLVFLPFLLAITIVTSSLHRYIQETTQSSSEQIVDQLTMNMSQFFEQIDKLTIFPLYDSDIIDLLSRHSKPGNEMDHITQDESIAQNFLWQPHFQQSNVRGTLLFALDGKLYSNSYMGTAKAWDQSNELWMAHAREYEGSYYIEPPRQYSYYSGDSNAYLSVVRVLRKPITLETIGYVKTDIYMNQFSAILENISFSENSLLYVLNSSDELLFPMDATSIPEPVNGTVIIDGNEYISTVSTAANDHIKIIALISVQDIQQNYRHFLSVAMFAMISILIISFFLIYMVSKHLSRPIINLSEKMWLIGKGHFDTRVEVTSHDEVGYLQQMFNEMATRIDHLINEVFRVSISEKNARISALQSQINPHFLYNTLETINMMAVIDGNDEISEAVTKLGQMLHYGVDHEQRFVTIQEEIENTRIYCSIQQLRNSALKPLELVCTLDMDNYILPKLIIQPFVENIIEHADYQDDLVVHIDINAVGEDMQIRIRDNGIPSEASRERIINRLNLEHTQTDDDSALSIRHGYGLRNVHRRIKLLYGEAYGVSYDSNYKDGTCLILSMKLLQKGEEEANDKDHDC